MRYVFAGFEARSHGFELRRDGERIGLEPKPLRLLLHLLSRAPEPVSAEELFATLWPDEAVTPSSLFQAVRLARRALGEDGPGVIQTLRGRGYRVGVPVERHAEAASSGPWATEDSFVGRASVLEELERDVEAALAGSPRTILIAGEPGIGKTRTVEALCASERLDGAEVVWGRCFEGTGALPLRPWLQIIRQLVRARSAEAVRELLGSDLATLAAVSDDVRALRPDAAPSPPLEADQQRFRFLEACAAFFQAIGRERPLVLVIDDLHHADVLSLALWEHAAREAVHARILLVGAYRHVAAPPNPPLEKLVAATARLPSAGSAFTLEGLEANEVGELLEAIAGARAPADFVKRVHERTAGNPLFVRGLARGLGSQRYDEPIPESVLSVVKDRLFLLEPASRSVLEVASVIGRDFDVDVVAAAAGLEHADCLAALDDAFRAGLVSSARDGLRWRFVHMVVGEAISDGLSPGQRATHHVHIARALRQRFAKAPDRAAGTVAEHYRRGLAAAQPDEAFEALIAAAEAAERSFSFEDAAEHREKALEVLDRVGSADPRVRFETLLGLAKTLGLLGARERRLDAGRRALEVARALGPRELARAAIAIYDVKQWGMADEPEVKAILEEALAGLPAAPSPERAHLVALKAHANLYAGLDETRREVRRAVEMARTYGGVVLREALYIQHHVMGGPDGFDTREETARELAALLEGGAASETAVIAFVDTACDQLARGDLERADFWHRMAVSASGTPPFPAMQWYLAVYAAGLAHMRGDFEEGERLSLEAFEVGQRIEQIQAPRARAAHMMILADARGDPGFAADLVEIILKQVLGLVAFPASAGAAFCIRAGRMERAAEIVASLAGDAFRSVPRDLGWTATMVQLAFATAALCREDWAAEIDALLEPVDSFHGVIPGAVLYRGSVAGARARLLELLGRREEAAAAYRRAIAGERKLGALPWAEANEQRLAALAR